jgi:hypothetical protein
MKRDRKPDCILQFRGDWKKKNGDELEKVSRGSLEKIFSGIKLNLWR